MLIKTRALARVLSFAGLNETFTAVDQTFSDVVKSTLNFILDSSLQTNDPTSFDLVLERTMPQRPLSIGLIVAVTLAGAWLPLRSAQAADLDYNFGDAPPPVPQTKVEFGTGWYVRGDIGAKDIANVVELARTSIDTVAFGLQRNHVLGYDLTLGGGYSFLNGVRADITVDFHQPNAINQYNQACVTPTAVNCSITGKFDSYDALANIYYDFGTWYSVTPYIGAGVGVAFGQSNGHLSGDPAGDYYAKYGYHNLAFALMAGVAVDVYSHVKLDIGYRYLDNGSVANSRLNYQEVRAGLRYMIDN